MQFLVGGNELSFKDTFKTCCKSGVFGRFCFECKPQSISGRFNCRRKFTSTVTTWQFRMLKQYNIYKNRSKSKHLIFVQFLISPIRGDFLKCPSRISRKLFEHTSGVSVMVSEVMLRLIFSPYAAVIRHWHCLVTPPDALKDMVPDDSWCVAPQPGEKKPVQCFNMGY